MIKYIVKKANLLFSALFIIFISFWFYKNNFFSNFDYKNILYWLLISIIAGTINVWAEAKKWRELLPRHFKTTTLIKYVLIGIAAALITPNRIGEYYGRKLPELSWKETIYSTLLARSIQSIPTLLFGSLAISFFFNNIVFQYQIRFTFLLAIPIILILWIIYAKKLKKIILLEIKNIRQYLQNINYIRAIIFAFIRYFSFFIGLYLFFLLFSSYKVKILEIFIGMSVVFLIKTMLPFLYFSGVGIRETIALTIFTPYGYESEVIVLSFLSLYISNHIIPGLLGLYYKFLISSRPLRNANA